MCCVCGGEGGIVCPLRRLAFFMTVDNVFSLSIVLHYRFHPKSNMYIAVLMLKMNCLGMCLELKIHHPKSTCCDSSPPPPPPFSVAAVPP